MAGSLERVLPWAVGRVEQDRRWGLAPCAPLSGRGVPRKDGARRIGRDDGAGLDIIIS
jgi:hypothetical protein